MNNRRNKSILVVEDDLDLVLAMQRRLSCAGFRVSIARSGTDAFRHARAGGVDAITLDVGLWDQVDGLDVASILSREIETAHIPIVFITGQADERFQQLYRRCGARYFLTKPFDCELLVHVLDSIFGEDDLSEAQRISTAKRRQPVPSLMSPHVWQRAEGAGP